MGHSAGAHRANKEVLVLAPTGKAVDEAMRDAAGDRGLTVAKALALIENDELAVDWRTVVVVDEASMVGTPELKKLLSCAAVGRSKMVLVGDAYQLSPVKARGGMFESLCDELPWSQRLSEVWRMREAAERDASLALRSARGNRLRKAIGWYRNHERLHTSLHKRYKCRVNLILVPGMHHMKFEPEFSRGFLRFPRIQFRIRIGRIYKQANLRSVGHRFK